MKAVINKVTLMLCIIVLASVIIGQEKNVWAENETYIDYIELKKAAKVKSVKLVGDRHRTAKRRKVS